MRCASGDYGAHSGIGFLRIQEYRFAKARSVEEPIRSRKTRMQDSDAKMECLQVIAVLGGKRLDIKVAYKMHQEA